MREYNFDGLVGPTHNYAGLSPGNLASAAHRGQVANPRRAARQGLRKMKFVADLGVGQAVLPPQPRPAVEALRRLGFGGADDEVLLRAAGADEGHLLRLCSSASAMWTANAATVAPSRDTADGRVHLTPANLAAMFHRALEAPQTTRTLRAIFADPARFVVHDALPAGAHFADEGAANHTRLEGEAGAVHLLAWGRSTWGGGEAPKVHPARQTREASAALARLHQLGDRALLWQQHPDGIDGGAFHTDVLAVGNGPVLLVHERAFVRPGALQAILRARVGDDLRWVQASARELPVADAVAAYPFNSQLVTLPDGGMAIIAPAESEANPAARRYLERVVAADNPVAAVHYLDLNESMDNGGGPACLRLRVPLTDAERAAVTGRVFLDDALFGELDDWIDTHYRDRLTAADLADPALLDETRAALDTLTRLLQLGSIYPFQQA